MEKPSEVDERSRLNTGELYVIVPSRVVPGQPLTDQPYKLVLSNKKKNFDRRMISLKTFTFRLADITDLKLRIPIIDYDVPLGKIIFWSAYPYYEWKSVQHAEARNSDLAPMLRAKWNQSFYFFRKIPLLNRVHKPVLFTYVIPVIPAGRVGAASIKFGGATLKPLARSTLYAAGELTNRALYKDQLSPDGELTRVSRIKSLAAKMKQTCSQALSWYSSSARQGVDAKSTETK